MIKAPRNSQSRPLCLGLIDDDDDDEADTDNDDDNTDLLRYSILIVRMGSPVEKGELSFTLLCLWPQSQHHFIMWWCWARVKSISVRNTGILST